MSDWRKGFLRSMRELAALLHPRGWTARGIARAAVGIAVLVLLAVAGAGLTIRTAAKGRTYSDAAAIPHRRVGLVLGCARTLADGRRNLFFQTRMAAAVRLFEAGGVDHLIVSGDNHIAGYDEPTDMRRALIAAGVPADRVYCDYAGFRTLDSVVRAREVFGQTNLTVISQRFHNERAIYIAARRGVDAIGYNAVDVDPAHSLRTRLREQGARVKTVMDVTLLRTRPKFFGPRIDIGVSPPAPGGG